MVHAGDSASDASSSSPSSGRDPMPGMQRYMEHFNRAINGKNGRYPPSAAAALPTCGAGASIKNELYAFETVCRFKHRLLAFIHPTFTNLSSMASLATCSCNILRRSFLSPTWHFHFLCFLMSIFSISDIFLPSPSPFSASQILLQSRLLPHAAHAL
jgi:hypothetical protein